MAEREVKKWVTINGHHVPIYEDDDSLEDKYKNINPGYTEDAGPYDKYHYNCVKCALAFEANMRGGDVEANPKEFGDLTEAERTERSAIVKALGKQGDEWDVGRPKRAEVIQQIEWAMEDYPKDARALLFLYHKNGKHVVNLINQNGELIIVDAQSGKHGDLKTMLKYYDTKNASLVRVDDVDIPDEWKDWAYKNR